MTVQSSPTHAQVVALNNRLPLADVLIATLVSIAIAIVGVSRPSYGGLSPSIFLIFAAFSMSLLIRPVTSSYQRRVTAFDTALVLWFCAKSLIEFSNASAAVPFASGPVLDCVLILMVVSIVKRRCASMIQVVAMGKIFLGAAVVVAVIALLQVAELGGVNNKLASVMGGSALQARIDNGWEIRATATVGHWTALGGYLCVATAVCCAIMIYAQQRRMYGFVLTILVAGQVSTFTFATYAVTISVLAATAFVLRPRITQVVAFVGLLSVFWVAFSDAISARFSKQTAQDSLTNSQSSLLPESVGFRLNVWITETIPAIRENPFSGSGLAVYNYVGTGRVSTLLQWTSPESEWMRTAISSGLVVLLLEIVTVAIAVRIVWKSTMSEANLSALPILVLALSMIVAMCIHSHLADRAFALSFWLVVGVVQVVSSGRSQRGVDV